MPVRSLARFLSLRSSPIAAPPSPLVLLAALAVVAIDLTYAPNIRPWHRLLLAAAHLTVCGLLTRTSPLDYRARRSLGLTVQPVQGWRWWFPVYGVFAALGLAVCLMVYISVRYLGNPAHFHSMFHSREQVASFAVFACLTTPIVEDAIYRLVACPPLARAIGPRPTVLIAGAAFSFLHIRYGNPAPDNLLAGFFLAWAFLKSGSIAVPVLFHSLGNIAAVTLHALLIHQAPWTA